MDTTGRPLVYIGSYTADTDGRGAGITVCAYDPETGELTPQGEPVATPSPSFLAVHPDGHTLYAVNELEPHGTLSSFAIAIDGSLTPLGTVPTGGSAPCHLAVDPTGQYVLTANYGDGRVSVHAIGGHGAAEPADVVISLAGHGPDTERQTGAHAHQVVFDADLLLVCDLGSDRVWRFRFAHGAATPDTPWAVTPGTGPRHLALAGPGRAWVVGELDPAVHPLPTGTPAAVETADTSVRNYPSAILASPDGRFVYVANRGPDTVTVLDVEGDTIRNIGESPVGAAWPRDAALVGEFLYVAAQDGDAVTALRRDPVTGLLGEPAVVLKTGSPTCITVGPRRG
ncbi:MAG: lactonase family protein [Streptomycetaceae bacterium]|nr:lactonase family protein [Streptomycetaceae bacterium]